MSVAEPPSEHLMILKKWMAWLLLTASATALAQTQNSVIESAGARIEVLGQNYAGNHFPIGPTQSRIVVYSLEEGRLQGATSIFVNGSYHASLIKGAYTELCYSPGDTQIGARQAQVGERSRDLPDTITKVRLLGAQTHYLRVREEGGRPVLYPMQASQAQRELPSNRLQLHTISRVAQNCIEVAPTQTVAQPERHILPADTLFEFARADRGAMTGAGLAAMDQLIQRLRKDYVKIERLHVIGHADPLGDRAINERLAIERANTVRQHIETHGRLQAPITAEGRGAREPVVTDCGKVATPRAIACNQPNRRVVIEVTGSKT